MSNVYYFLVFLCSALFTFGLSFAKIPFFRFCKSSVSQLNILLDKQTDENAKQGELIKNLKLLLMDLVSLLTISIILITLSLLPMYLYSLYNPDLIGDIETSSTYFYLSMVSGSLVLFIPRKKTSNYSDWSKLLHSIILDNYNVSKFLFSVEKRFFFNKNQSKDDNFVIITGLARAGTTALTNLFFETGKFHSLSYANMPFLMAPFLWQKINKSKKKKYKERAHGDQVMFGFDTIEALEEYFFKTMLADDFITKESLRVHQINESTYQSYLIYQNLIKIPSKNTLYLAKNNNMILRYESLRKFNKDFKSVVIFRSPIEHAYSLLRQDLNFCKLQTQDSFVKDYMNWLGHHEFGLNHKTFDLGQAKNSNPFKRTDINYWLTIWTNYYTHVIQYLDDSNFLLVDYDDLLQNPRGLLQKLEEVMNIPLSKHFDKVYKPRNIDMKNIEINELLLRNANTILIALKEKKLLIEQ